MKLWLRKVSVVLITLMTVGMYIPPTYLDANADNDKLVSENDRDENMLSAVPEAEIETDAEVDDDLGSSFDEELIDIEIDSSTYVIEEMAEQAKDFTLAKLGPKIVNKIEDDIESAVLPNMEEVLKMILDDADKERLNYLSITEDTESAYGEKIFHLYDLQAEEDVAMFHVRRDKRPRDGYWFNFHYHLSDDDFEEHYNLADIYWDKNTPPKWMS
ncbi:YpjP family protein [Evansella halocellulosilytica]|uniref:YpjP family protein n=1 Tax=Evansella halocellulosilytica TaxID=2011013 RepID=UPI000BB782B6|nr:YpjP family protein [Evansella halocellulosilytica]